MSSSTEAATAAGATTKVTRRLQAAWGTRVYAPSLTGLGERSHVVSLGDRPRPHIDDVVNLLFYEDLHDVILVGHSYGGMVITGVADRAADRVGQGSSTSTPPTR